MSTYAPIAPRPAPAAASGWIGWCQSNLFHDWKTSLGTVLSGLVFLALAPKFFNWAIADAVREVAAEWNMEPATMQALLWIIVRGKAE